MPHTVHRVTVQRRDARGAAITDGTGGSDRFDAEARKETRGREQERGKEQDSLHAFAGWQKERRMKGPSFARMADWQSAAGLPTCPTRGGKGRHGWQAHLSPPCRIRRIRPHVQRRGSHLFNLPPAEAPAEACPTF